jgi:predicted metal-binding protein
MRSLSTKICPNTDKPCAGKCPGYGSSSNCPPLIVLAVIACAPMCEQGGACR